jgi:hypothetical protein
LVKAVERANEAVYEEGQKRNGRMGSTIVAAVHDDGLLHVAHVGDARAYLLRGTALKRLTRDDTWVQKQVDAGLLTLDEAAQHELRHVVTQALGNKPDVEVHLAPEFSLEPADVFLLCSDGLYDSVPEEQLGHLLRQHSPAEAAAALVQKAIRANAADNITAVVVQVARQPVVAATDPAAADPEATLSAARPLATAVTLRPPSAEHPVPVDRRSSEARKTPVWLLITLATVAVLVAAIGLFVWLALRQNRAAMTKANTPLPTLTEQPAVATVPALAPASPTPEPTTLPAILPTATFSTTAEAALPATTLTPQSTETAVALACVEEGNRLFVWDDQQISAGNCTQVVQREEFVLEPDEQVRILGEEPRSVSGPDSGCQTNEFIRIQSVNNPDVEGWVLANGLRRISPEESCGP